MQSLFFFFKFVLCLASCIIKLLVMFTILIYNKLKMEILLHVLRLYSY